MVSRYELKLENDRWLDVIEFVKFCVANQNKKIEIIVNNEGHCLRFCGVYDVLDQFQFDHVLLRTFNLLEQHTHYEIDNSLWSFWLKNIDPFDFDFDYTWSEEKVFGCFFGSPRAHRLGIATHLITCYDSKSIVVAKFPFGDENGRNLFDIQRLFAWHPSSIDNLNLLNDKKYFSDHEYVKGWYTQENTLSHRYKDFLIDIISEPVCEGRSFYPTEKLARSILCRRPFIVMATKNYLDYLHQMGFYTFNEFWNEEYDGFESKERYLKIIELIDRLAKLPKHELINLYHAMTYQLDHNYELLVSQKYRTDITEIH